MGIPYLSVVSEVNAGIKFCNVLWFLCIVTLLIMYLPVVLGAFAKLRKATVCFIMSVCLQGTTWLPLDGL